MVERQVDQVAGRSPQRQEDEGLGQQLRGEQPPSDEGRPVEAGGLVVEDKGELERMVVGRSRNRPLTAEKLKWRSKPLDAGGTPQGGLPYHDGTATGSGAEGRRGPGKSPPEPQG